MFSTIAIASTLVGLAAAAPIPQWAEGTPLYTTTHFTSDAYKGSCGWTESTTKNFASIAANSSIAKPGDYCGKTINITSTWSGKSVLAQVVDEQFDAPASYLNISQAAFDAVEPDSYGYFVATYSYVFGDDAYPVPSYSDSDSSSSASSPAAAPAAQSSTQAASNDDDSSSSSSSSSSSKKQAQYTPYSSSSSTAQYTPPTTSKAYTPAYTPSSSSSQAPAYTPKASYGGGQYSGTATYYFQNNNAGACGSVNSDSAYIVALDSSIYDGGKWCGQSVTLTNRNTGKSLNAVVSDECPTCGGSGNIDLSQGLFQALGNGADGVFPVSFTIN